ncbi:ABC transporter ATP-binding protein [Nakamurella flavida]|uniref:ABC transporter ATP-binding protein n=1 Tax=Nakamurella flavida TaxID=363630 RepID=A0A938YLN7_9ACTN|nr:ABC transporter ATP-binding protein [Nakamurella flavida]
MRGLTITGAAGPLVRDVSFEVGAGERVGVIGTSGSGKTLTCLAVAGLLPATLAMTGSITLAGGDLELTTASERELAAVRGSRVGMVFQEPMTALNPTWKVGRQVAGAMRRRVPPRRSATAVLDLLARTGLDDPARIADSYPHQLSGGQRQRIVLAIALADRPDLLVCDEPTTALDVTVQARVLALIAARTREVGSALLFISHDLAVVASVCDRILVMDDGAIVESGPVVRLLTAPEHDRTRALLADADLGGTR